MVWNRPYYYAIIIMNVNFKRKQLSLKFNNIKVHSSSLHFNFTMSFHWHLYLMAFIYTLAGINHFKTLECIKNHSYFSPNPLLNLSGTTEIILGITLLIPTSTCAGNYRPVNSHFPHSYLHTKMQKCIGLNGSYYCVQLFLFYGYQYT
jgi:hypothetical protein